MKNNTTLAPICLFVYSRLNETKITVESLQKNNLASDSQLFIFSDGYKRECDKVKIQAVRDYIHQIKGFANITIFESEVNKGLANSIISGITKIITEYHKVIVLEDDLILSTNFLDFMNQALTFYEEQKRVFSVSGFSFPLELHKNYKYDVAFSLRASSWGWGTWLDRWEHVDWELKSYSSFKWNLLKHIKFNLGGSDLSRLLHRQVKGEIDSWAVRFTFHQYMNNYLDVFPVKSKVMNNGFTSESTHTKCKSDRFETTLDISEKRTFSFLEDIKVEKYIMKQFCKHYSYTSRLKDRFSKISWIKNK
ncbi:MAG: glycosyl transferase [Paludibacter sp.]|nr:glycosyl transferase [Paludibacter sp.]